MLKTLLLASTAMALMGALAIPAFAQSIPIRIVGKDLLTTNPDDVNHIQQIEDAMRERGHDLDLQLVDLPGATYADALGVMLLSGDIPDLIYFQGGDSQMANQGILEDLRPWIAEAPNLQAALWPHNVERLENYPYLLYIYTPRAPQPVIRTDWLAATGLEPPDTVEEYVTLFEAIRDGDLDGNGQADSYGLTAFLNTNELDSIFNQAFGVTATWMQNEAGEFVHARTTSQERDKIAFYAQLAADGLFDPEFVTNTFDVKEDKFYTGRAGVVFGSSPEVIDIYTGKMRQAHPGEDISLTLLPIPSGPAGQGLAAMDVSKEARGWAMSSISEHKEEVIALLDFLASPDGQMLDRLGFEGREYTNEGGTISYLDPISTWYARFFVAANWQPQPDWKSEAAQAALANLTSSFTADNVFVWPAEYAADIDAAENVYRSWVARFVTGEASMDQWDTYVAEWNAAGGQRLTDYARTQLNATN